MICWASRLLERRWAGHMEDFIARENIKRFEAQLESSTDKVQRAEIQALLDAERRRLIEIRSARIAPRPRA